MRTCRVRLFLWETKEEVELWRDVCGEETSNPQLAQGHVKTVVVPALEKAHIVW